jgi:hypothetical protein
VLPCGQPITDADGWNRDHHPQKRFFGRSVRPGVNMRKLYAHEACNSSFKLDEEYFVAAMPVQAMGSWSADAVFRDFREDVRDGHWRSLFERVRAQFGRVELPGGRIPFHAEFERLQRIAWKLARGSYFDQVGRVLPEQTLRTIEVVLPQQAGEALRNTNGFGSCATRPRFRMSQRFST